jgi:two-component system, LytTR family, response regulator
MERHAKIITLLDGTVCFNVPTQEGLDRVDLKNIIYLKGESSQTGFYLLNKKIIVASKSLMFWGWPALKHGFVRIHQSYVINLLHYVHYQKGAGGYVVMNDGSHLTVSESFKESFLHFMNDEIDERDDDAERAVG